MANNIIFNSEFLLNPEPSGVTKREFLLTISILINIEHFFFHFVDYIRMDFGNTDKFSCTLKN